MAITKFNNRRNSKCSNRTNKLKRGIKYITDRKKTSSLYIGGTGVDENNAFDRMQTVKQFYGKEGGREYIHFSVSFKGKRDEELIFFIAENISAIIENFQVLFAVHTNTANTHIHFIINSVNVNNGKKFSQSRADLQRLKDIINKISNEFGLELDEMVVDEEDDCFFDYEDYYEGEEELIEPMIFMDHQTEKSGLIEPMIFYDKILPLQKEIRNMIEGKFYAIFGSNAVGVADNWYKVTCVKKYIKKFNTKRFDTFAEAELYALEQASILLPYNYIPPHSLKCNDVVFLKDMLRIQ